MLVSENKKALDCLPHNRPRFCDKLTNQELEALHFILGLSEDYPNIQDWYVDKVVPGLRLGTRFLLPVHREGELVGVGIAKNEGSERKICTVRVAPHHFGRGLGLRIFDGLLKWLDDDRPCLTVSSTKLPAFERIFDWYGFHFTGAEADVYVPGKQEFGYNGAVLAKAPQLDLTSPADYSRFSIAAAKSME
ncbi:GNAT superfamily N-acetyltransferase [Agrobacterium larrymoorei]|uniref:GNAT superfamily N-acetyltransferase n=1 Tax=Agrobacterium larrymoorei TaxID=160699 RepID=A0AAJ2B838_9HYPH|nr:GNAT family N-acetyltransferase [Agrobacterium larrymoorei]MDR6100994.1 GNAT superfamily N-acetyltransferase [Agrobacterium larrymoorei]